MALLVGAAVLFILWWVGKNYSAASPKALARLVRQIGGVASLALAAFLLFRGRLDVAIPVGGFGAYLLGLRGFALPGWAQRTQATPGAQSRVRSALLEMTLDHDTGALAGHVLAGPFEGRSLDELGEAQLADLAALCLSADPEGSRLLEAYLDRRFPGRRKAAQDDADAGPRVGGGRGAGAPTEQEAYEILGLQPGAGDDEVRRAHRALMKKLHPDQGGSTYLATRVNQAKDILLNRHR
ncbi:DnaJ domain-containing protein [Alsobacter sp. SYSU BS001988]